MLLWDETKRDIFGYLPLCDMVHNEKNALQYEQKYQTALPERLRIIIPFPARDIGKIIAIPPAHPKVSVTSLRQFPS